MDKKTTYGQSIKIDSKDTNKFKNEQAIKEQIDVSLLSVLDSLSSSWHSQYKSNDKNGGNIVIQNNTASHVIVETIIPTSKSNFDISDNLKSELKRDKISSVIKVRLSKSLAKLSSEELRRKILESNSFEYVVHYFDEILKRYPEEGQITGTIHDIAFTTHVTLTPTKQLDEYLTPIHACMTAIEKVVQNLDKSAKYEIAEKLNQPEDEQTWRMAGLILSNAMVFYDLIADKIILNNGKKCKTLDEMHNKNLITQSKLDSAWRDILDYNYNPIFSIARGILSALDENSSEEIIKALYTTAVKIRSKKAARSSTMYGELLQKVIVDRDKLASYYTRPQAAMLLATLAIPRPNDPIYKSDSIGKYRIADFACGTGLLLSSAYRQIIFNYEASHLETKKTSPNVLHKTMMEKCLIGLDVLPIATHLAVSALAMMFPMQVFGNTGVKTMPIGKDYDYVKKRKKISHYRLGSLDLISNEKEITLTPSLTPVRGKEDNEAVEKPWSLDECHHRIPDSSCDLIVMNPPFIRDTNHAGKHGGSQAPAWAAFGSSKIDQLNMGKLARKKFAGTCAHGNAGLASNFIAVCDKKIRDGGTIALIIPATVANGASWTGVRALIENNYDIKIISIARPKISSRDRSFSSDTGMGEILLFARKRENIKNPRGLFVSLQSRPNTILEATQIGKSINELSGVDKLETENRGTTLRIGSKSIGHAMDCPLMEDWKYVNVCDPYLEQIAWKIKQRLVSLNMCFKIGPHTLDITGNYMRGPFTSHPIGGTNFKYTSLWNNKQKQQKCMIVPYDTILKSKAKATKSHIKKIWETAAHVHMNIGPDFTSNSLIAAYTMKKTVGGRVWPTITMDKKYEKPFVIWCNSSIGILLYWSMVGKQQLGRGMTSRTKIQSFPIPDFTKMHKKTLDDLSNIFDEYSNYELDRMKNLWKDKIRMTIDEKIVKLLKIDLNLDDTRLRLCLEPSISGGKPESALINEHERVIK